MSTAGNRLLVGIGNELRGDDGVGPYIVRRLEASGLGGVDYLVLGADVTALSEALGTTRHAYVFDALHSGAPAGTVRRIDALSEELPKELASCSTHGLALADAFELANALGYRPETLEVFGVEGQTFGLGRGLSAPVHAAAAGIVCDLTCEFTRPLPQEAGYAAR
jgi:hydrogenase maturation protease